MKKPCPRTLDKPILLFGLEIEDIALLVLLIGIGCLVLGPIIPGIVGIIAWVVLLHFKKDKPQGYMMHYLYSHGLAMEGLMPPICNAQQYGTYGTSKK